MNENAKRKPDYSIYALKKRPRGEKHPKEDYKNICSVWLDEKYDSTIRPECSAKDLADIWNEALKGAYGTLTIKIRGLNQNTTTPTTEVKHYAQDIINAISPAKDPDLSDDDVPF